MIEIRNISISWLLDSVREAVAQQQLCFASYKAFHSCFTASASTQSRPLTWRKYRRALFWNLYNVSLRGFRVPTQASRQFVVALMRQNDLRRHLEQSSWQFTKLIWRMEHGCCNDSRIEPTAVKKSSIRVRLRRGLDMTLHTAIWSDGTGMELSPVLHTDRENDRTCGSSTGHSLWLHDSGDLNDGGDMYTMFMI
nr:hypothetical protein CFP56_58729 [Quercus suber]